MIGTTIGKYRILARLGRGGMGTVYKAVDETLDREVAIKVLNSELGDPKLMARFRAEATTLARLNHPEIATIYEIYRTEAADLLMVMELVRGETLDQLSIRSGPLPAERAAYLMAQVLNALGYAHRAGIVHRDLKPANVMLTDSGAVKIMDFGIARVLGAEHLTSDGTMMGTPAYMAPEQVIGKEIDARADLYSAGVVLYRLLTGCLPFQSDTPIGMVQKQLWDPPTPIRSYRDDLPEWCETILHRALAKSPGDRFQSAAEFRSALLSAIGNSTKPLDADAATPLPYPTFPLDLASALSQTVEQDLTPSQIAAAPTVTLARQRTPADVGATRPREMEAAFPAPLQATASTDTRTASSPISAAPAPATESAIPRAAAPARRRLGMAAAILAAVVVGGGVLALALRDGSRTAGGVASAPSTAPANSGDPASASVPLSAPQSAADAPANAVVVAAATDAAAGTSSSQAPAATNGAGGIAPLAARPRGPGRTTANAAVAASATAPEPASPVPDTSTDPAAAAATAANAPAAAVFAPLIFSAQTVVAEGGKNRQRDANVRLENGIVTVTGKDQKLVTSMPVDAVVGFTYSNSKQPMWNTPQGPAEILHLDSGAFGFLKGDRHWLSLRTDGMSLVLRLRDQDSRRVILALEERLGKKAERVAEREER